MFSVNSIGGAHIFSLGVIPCPWISHMYHIYPRFRPCPSTINPPPEFITMMTMAPQKSLRAHPLPRWLPLGRLWQNGHTVHIFCKLIFPQAQFSEYLLLWSLTNCPNKYRRYDRTYQCAYYEAFHLLFHLLFPLPLHGYLAFILLGNRFLMFSLLRWSIEQMGLTLVLVSILQATAFR